MGQYSSLKDFVFTFNPKEWKHSELKIYPQRFRNVKIGDYGVVDMISTRDEIFDRGYNESRVTYNYLNIIVYSIIDGAVSNNDLFDLAHKVRGVRHWYMSCNIEKSPLIDIEGIIICREINLSDDASSLLDLMDKLNVYIVNGHPDCIFWRHSTLPSFELTPAKILPF